VPQYEADGEGTRLNTVFYHNEQNEIHRSLNTLIGDLLDLRLRHKHRKEASFPN
jgi:hypothetical protein